MYMSDRAKSNTERFGMRVDPSFFEVLDNWRRLQPRIISRAEAIRQLVRKAVEADGITMSRRPRPRLED